MSNKSLVSRRWLLSRRYWIFDLDGTLTQPQHDFQAIKKALGIPLDADILNYLGGLPSRQAKQKYVLLDQIEHDLAGQAQAARGARALLDSLASEGVEMAILTRNSKANAHLVLEVLGLSHYFKNSHVLGREQAKPKPNPEGVEWLLSRWQAEAVQALMVGDYLYDLLCARNAGVAAVHVDSGGVFPWPEKMDLGVIDLEQLLELISVSRP